ncbi:MAG: MAPEG family protein, partial [Sphingomonas sp.]|nr:MAPEG family protein [Sphingomonas sp.]
MAPLSVLLATAAACVLLNIWLGARIARLRRDLKVSVGDGGHEFLLRRMRAQANFIEIAPFVLIILGGLELSAANPAGLAVIATLFILSRIAHG